MLNYRNKKCAYDQVHGDVVRALRWAAFGSALAVLAIELLVRGHLGVVTSNGACVGVGGARDAHALVRTGRTGRAVHGSLAARLVAEFVASRFVRRTRIASTIAVTALSLILAVATMRRRSALRHVFFDSRRCRCVFNGLKMKKCVRLLFWVPSSTTATFCSGKRFRCLMSDASPAGR